MTRGNERHNEANSQIQKRKRAEKMGEYQKQCDSLKKSVESLYNRYGFYVFMDTITDFANDVQKSRTGKIMDDVQTIFKESSEFIKTLKEDMPEEEKFSKFVEHKLGRTKKKLLINFDRFISDKDKFYLDDVFRDDFFCKEKGLTINMLMTLAVRRKKIAVRYLFKDKVYNSLEEAVEAEKEYGPSSDPNDYHTVYQVLRGT